jgi:hypothetical protein
MDQGVIPGVQKTTQIANDLQRQVEARVVVKMFPNDERIGLKMYGVFYHKHIMGRKHIYMVHARNEVVQEMVAEARANARIPMVDKIVFHAADEMQRLKKGMATFQAAMAKTVESKSDSKSRRQVGKQLHHKKTEEANAAADAKQLTEHGLWLGIMGGNECGAEGDPKTSPHRREG